MNSQQQEAEEFYPKVHLIKYYEKMLAGLQQRVKDTQKRLEELKGKDE